MTIDEFIRGLDQKIGVSDKLVHRNDTDECVYVWISLKTGLFLYLALYDEEPDKAVFSVFRDKELLVADYLTLDDIYDCFLYVDKEKFDQPKPKKMKGNFWHKFFRKGWDSASDHYNGKGSKHEAKSTRSKMKRFMKKYHSPTAEVTDVEIESNFVSSGGMRNNYEKTPCENCTQRYTNYCNTCIHKR